MPDQSNKPRAMHDDDKDRRRLEILGAAEALLVGDPSRLPSVADVAKKAGLAKGTVYLYFQSKEDLLLSLHGLHTEQFFEALHQRLIAGPIGFEDLLEVTRAHLIEVPTYMPLAGQCLGSFGKNVSETLHEAFKQRIAYWLTTCGEQIEAQFPILDTGTGALLLSRSYALMLGLWQLSQANEEGNCPLSQTHFAPVVMNYNDEAGAALLALWRGHLTSATEQLTTIEKDPHQ